MGWPCAMLVVRVDIGWSGDCSRLEAGVWAGLEVCRSVAKQWGG